MPVVAVLSEPDVERDVQPEPPAGTEPIPGTSRGQEASEQQANVSSGPEPQYQVLSNEPLAAAFEASHDEQPEVDEGAIVPSRIRPLSELRPIQNGFGNMLARLQFEEQVRSLSSAGPLGILVRLSHGFRLSPS